MEMPTVFGEQKFKKRKGTNIKKGHIKKVSCLDDIVIEKLEKPHTLKDFSLSSYSQSYCLTLENIKQARYVDYQGKGEVWADIYLFEYNSEKNLREDFLGVLYKQKELTKEGEESLRILVQDKYLILVQAYDNGSEESAKNLVNIYKNKFGFKEISVTYTFN